MYLEYNQDQKSLVGRLPLKFSMCNDIILIILYACNYKQVLNDTLPYNTSVLVHLYAVNQCECLLAIIAVVA